MQLSKELLKEFHDIKNDEMLVLHTRDDKELIGKLFNLLDEMDFIWASGMKLDVSKGGNMQYIYIYKGRVTWDSEIVVHGHYDYASFSYYEVEEFLEGKKEKSAEDNSLFDYALSLLNVSKEELIEMKERNDNKVKLEGMVKKIVKTFDDLGYVIEGKCKDCSDCPYNNNEFSCKQTVILCHLMEEGKLIL